MQRIYLDNNATTALDPRVLDAMMEEFKSGPSNPSSIHYYGQEAKKRLVHARHQIADILGMLPHEILFTSGGTEGINFLLHYFTSAKQGGHIITTDIEHPAAYYAIDDLKSRGFTVTYLQTGPFGAPTPEQIESAIEPNTTLLMFSSANSETGVKIDVDSIAELALERKIPFILDGVGRLGKDLFSIHPGISGAAFSGHKIHGPKGSGCVFLRKGYKGNSLLKGGGQEYGLRGGTENLAGILGLAKAIELLNQKEDIEKIEKLRNLFEKLLLNDEIAVNGEGIRVANTSNLFFPSIDGESLLIHLDLLGVAASHGSACMSGSLQPSRVLLNMGYSPERARHSLRFSLSRLTTIEEIRKAAAIILSIQEKL